MDKCKCKCNRGDKLVWIGTFYKHEYFPSAWATEPARTGVFVIPSGSLVEDEYPKIEGDTLKKVLRIEYIRDLPRLS